MKALKKEVIEVKHTLELTQTEVNTIAIIIGKTTDDLVKEGGRYHNIKSFITGNKLVDLFTEFMELAERK